MSIECPNCGENNRTIGCRSGCKIRCRHCGLVFTIETKPECAVDEMGFPFLPALHGGKVTGSLKIRREKMKEICQGCGNEIEWGSKVIAVRYGIIIKAKVTSVTKERVDYFHPDCHIGMSSHWMLSKNMNTLRRKND